MCTCNECIMELEKELQKGVKGDLDILVTHNSIVIWVVRYGTSFRLEIHKEDLENKSYPEVQKYFFTSYKKFIFSKFFNGV